MCQQPGTTTLPGIQVGPPVKVITGWGQEEYRIVLLLNSPKCNGVVNLIHITCPCESLWMTSWGCVQTHTQTGRGQREPLKHGLFLHSYLLIVVDFIGVTVVNERTGFRVHSSAHHLCTASRVCVIFHANNGNLLLPRPVFARFLVNYKPSIRALSCVHSDNCSRALESVPPGFRL